MAGYKCITCGGTTRVSFTGPDEGLQWRRRWCLDPACGDRFSTYEVEVTYLKKLTRRAAIRYSQEGSHLMQIIDPSLLLPRDRIKMQKKQAKWQAGEKKRKDQVANAKTHERLDAVGIAKLMASKKKST